LKKVLDANYEADKNHVSVTERETIRKENLREAYYRVYKVGSAPKKPADKDGENYQAPGKSHPY
jgi:hypothetical protein